jgi:flagellar basal body-associated protein FliL
VKKVMANKNNVIIIVLLVLVVVISLFNIGAFLYEPTTSSEKEQAEQPSGVVALKIIERPSSDAIEVKLDE